MSEKLAPPMAFAPNEVPAHGPVNSPFWGLSDGAVPAGLIHAPPAPVAPAVESILEEAQRLTHGDRRRHYGHPLDDYGRTAALVSALLAHKLKEPLTPSETALIMVCVKLSRQINSPKRDNAVDGAGYFWVAQECLDEALRRTNYDKGDAT